MDSSFNSQPSLRSSSSSRRLRSPRIFTTVKGLVQRPSTKSTSRKGAGSARSKDDAFHGHGDCKSYRRNLQNTSKTEVLWKRRGQTPDMDEYLTLDELESVWYTQDSYQAFMYAPQTITQYTFQEAVEAPLIVKHDISSRPMEAARPAPAQADPIPRITGQNDSSVVNGSLHPALRSAPYLSDDNPLKCHAPPPRLVISVPSSNWTYGRT